MKAACRVLASLCLLAGTVATLDAAMPAPSPRAVAADEGDHGRSETVASQDGIVVEAPATPLLVGDWFEIVVHGPFAADAKLVPDPEQDALLVSGSATRSLEVDRVVFVQRVCAYRDGELSIEGWTVSSGGESLPVPAFGLRVGSGLDPDTQPRLAGPLPPVALPMPRGPIGVLLWPPVLLLVLLATLIVRTTRPVPVFVRRTPPDQLAIDALQRLRLHLPTDADGISPFVVDVSDVLRRYIEGRFDLHAPARTTEEFLLEVARRDDAVAEREETLGGFLTSCDLVKFARARPGREELLALLATAESFVEETRGARVAEPEPELEGVS